MAYLTYEEYKELLGGEITPQEFDKLLPRASIALDTITRHFYQKHSLEDDVAYRKRHFKVALAAQIEYFHDLGATNSHGLETPTQVQIGRTSMTYEGRGTNNGGSQQDHLISSDVYFYLSGTGLLYRGLEVRP